MIKSVTLCSTKFTCEKFNHYCLGLIIRQTEKYKSFEMFGFKLILPCRTFGIVVSRPRRHPLGLFRAFSFTTKLNPRMLPGYTAVPGVVGDWKDYNIRLATMSDYEQISLHVRTNFVRYNKIHEQFLEYEVADDKDHDELVKIAIGHQLSFIVAKRGSFEVILHV